MQSIFKELVLFVSVPPERPSRAVSIALPVTLSVSSMFKLPVPFSLDPNPLHLYLCFSPNLPSTLVTSVDLTIKCFQSLSFFPHVAHKRLGHLWEVACLPRCLRRALCVPLPQLPSPGSGLGPPLLPEVSLPLTLFIHAPLRTLHMVSFLLHSAAHYTLSCSYPAPFKCVSFFL